MPTGSRAICILMAFLATVAELVSSALGQVHAKPSNFSEATANEVGGSPAVVVAESAASAQEITAAHVAKVSNFSTSPTEMRIIAHAPLLRVIGTCVADGRQMASLADANERQLLFVKITRG